MMKKRKRSKTIDQEMFDKVKSLISYGLSSKHIHDVIGLSVNVVNRIKKVDDFDAYREMVNTYTLQMRAKKTNGSGILSDTEYKDFEVKQPTETLTTFELMLLNELQHVNQTLTRLAEAWEAKPEGFMNRLLK